MSERPELELEPAGAWEELQAARAYLVEALRAHPDVSLIDIGYAPGESGAPAALTAGAAAQLVVRIHLRRPPELVSLDIPEKPDVPMRLIYGDYVFEFQ